MLKELAAGLRQARGVLHKRDISPLVKTLTRFAPSNAAQQLIAIGDDCAAIPDGDGYLLFAIEGFINEFVATDPWFAGYCGVMVNVSDVYAMGGRPIAVVDALWSRDVAHAQKILEGMAAASQIYGVPIVGGHSNARNDREQLAVAILGRAQNLLTSFDAKPGDLLISAIDLRGRYREPHAYWDASTGSDAARLRGDLDVLAQIAEAGLSVSAKDISMAGVIGTALMLLECAGLGATIDIHDVPKPTEASLSRWLLSTFPSFGFILAVAEENVAAVLERFEARGVASAVIGRCDDSGIVRLSDGDDEEPVWNFADEPLIGCGKQSTVTAHA
jgi:uncharacterized protein